jgi:hypothetical protein
LVNVSGETKDNEIVLLYAPNSPLVKKSEGLILLGLEDDDITTDKFEKAYIFGKSFDAVNALYVALVIDPIWFLSIVAFPEAEVCKNLNTASSAFAELIAVVVILLVVVNSLKQSFTLANNVLALLDEIEENAPMMGGGGMPGGMGGMM